MGIALMKFPLDLAFYCLQFKGQYFSKVMKTINIHIQGYNWNIIDFCNFVL